MSRFRAVLAGIALLQLLVAPAIPAQEPPAEVRQPAKQGLYDKSLEAAQQTLYHYGVYDNPAELDRVTEIGFRIAQETGFDDFPFTFHIIDMVIPNAFAMPGGHMFITRGMLDLDLTDDMLAALLGHEIAHVVKQHGSKMKKRAMLLNTFGQALLVGAIVGAANSGNNSNNNVYSPYDPRYGGNRSADMIQATAATTTAVSELLLRKYSRGFEDESDEEGQRWAAAAGFDPHGTRYLMELMAARMPESGGYGYWRTHPFMEDRATIGEARADGLQVQPPSDADIYRARTQKKLIAYSERTDLDPASRDLLQLEALWTWPKGPVAEQLRLEQLHEQKEAVLFEKPLDQDLGALIAAYRDQQEEVLRLTPSSSLPKLLDEEILEIVELQEKNYARASEVFEGGVYQTRFLELFLSNFPEAPERATAALKLGNAYSRLGRQTAAVGAYLESWRGAPDDPSGQRARAGLKVLAPNLDQLGALQELEMQSDDLELQEMARGRLRDLASSYDDPANGAEYLKRFPDGLVSERVATRLDSLADSLYAEMVLYKSVGDHVKALQKARQILTQAPMSPAADRLRDSVVAES